MTTKKAAAGVSPHMERLAAYISRALKRPLPRAVEEKTRHHVLDTIGAMVSGSCLLPGRQAIAYVKSLGGVPEATVAGSRIVTSAVNAALANGMLAHADETDDSHSPSLTHPGCGIVSAALAMGERYRCGGTALLRAVALGYDVNARLSFALGGVAFHGTGHTTHSFGPTFGAAAAGAALAGLTPAQVRHTLSYAAQQASGISCYARDQDHVEKAFEFGGMPARNGVTAATMVASGCTAVDDVFSGVRNFFFAFDESPRIGKAPDPSQLERGLGIDYQIMNTNIKRWSVGSPIQAPLDLLLDLIRGERVTAADVEKLVVRVYSTGATTTDNRDMSDICMQHMCAVMLLDGMVTFESAHDNARMRDPRVLALRKRIELIADDEFESRRPARHGAVSLTLRDGRRLERATGAVRGTAQNPMTRAELDEKAYDLMAGVLGKRRARALCEAVWNIERLKDVRKLRPLLQA
jgi:2-methylcitrate dehydratase PrpD